MVAMAAAPSAAAQRQSLPPSEIAQIADEALRVVLPPESSLSGVPVASRQLAFDFERTLTAFGASPGADTALRLARPVTPASRSVLSDCSQMDKKPCASLGWRAYVWIEPVSVTDSNAVVRANVNWADRRSTPFIPSSPAAGTGFLTGFSTKLHLVRTAGGRWRCDKELGSAVG